MLGVKLNVSYVSCWDGGCTCATLRMPKPEPFWGKFKNLVLKDSVRRVYVSRRPGLCRAPARGTALAVQELLLSAGHPQLLGGCGVQVGPRCGVWR